MSHAIDQALYVFLGVVLLIAGLQLSKKGRMLLIQARGYATPVLGAATWVAAIPLKVLVYLFLRYRVRLIVLGFFLGVALGSVYGFRYAHPAEVLIYTLAVALGVVLSIVLLVAGMKLAKRGRNLALKATGYAATVVGPAFGGYIVFSWWLHFSYHD